MKLDRELQLRMLHMTAEAHPHAAQGFQLRSLEPDLLKLASNARYLHEHGLIEATMPAGNASVGLASARITAKGQDFLADDGGLSAILGTVTIKIHEDTLRDMIERGVLQSTLPQAEKTGVVQTLRALPADSIKHLTMKLLDLGLENTPRAAQLIQNWLS
ncbi:hypothetical protein ACS8E9_09445 [Pseudomonas neustonica]|uniref:hypothetical protein n=1 Tax=Pseudomonas neustonica TaxID=2487346 RepID=UPI003F476E9D